MQVASKQTALLVIFVLVLVLGVIFVGKMGDLYTAVTDKSACKASVKAHSTFCALDGSKQEIKCPTIYSNIKDNDEDKVQRQLAKSLYDCWDKFGQGDLEICGDSGVYCAVCDYITFEKDDVKIKNFPKYLAETNVPNTEIKYLEFLNRKHITPEDYSKLVDNNEKISTELDSSVKDTYATIFVQVKERDTIKNYVAKSEVAAPGIGSLFLGYGTIKKGLAIRGLAWIGAGTVGTSIAVGGGVLLAGGALLTGLSTYFVEEPFDKISYVYFAPYEVETFKTLGCKELPVSQS